MTLVAGDYDTDDLGTESEVRGRMAAAGLARIAKRDTPFGTSVLVGRRAGETMLCAVNDREANGN